MPRVKAKKIQTPQSPNPTPRVMMHRGRHRSMRTQVDAMRILSLELLRELEKTYADVNPKPSLVHDMSCLHESIRILLAKMGCHADEEYPDGIPDTV